MAVHVCVWCVEGVSQCKTVRSWFTARLLVFAKCDVVMESTRGGAQRLVRFAAGGCISRPASADG